MKRAGICGRLLTATFAAAAHASDQSETSSLWTHLRGTADLGEQRALSAAWTPAPVGVLTLTVTNSPGYAWVTIPPPAGGWDLARRESVEAAISNRSASAAQVLLWVVGDRGWDAVPDAASLAPGTARRFACRLRDAYPDGTPKIDPGAVREIRIMVSGRVTKPLQLDVTDLAATGELPAWTRPAGRHDVPPVEDGEPAPGRRVRLRLAGDEHTGIYSVLQLPEDWRPGGRFPVVAELPGNSYFASVCYSTGRPEQCVMGFGVTRGRGAICLGLPFIDRASGTIVESGWGNADDTAEHVVRVIEEVCARFGGDRSNLVLAGFSRGAIACGYIGLRNDRIAPLWKGFIACQHYDGDGWSGVTMAGAIERAARFRGRGVFQFDNPAAQFRPVMEAMKTDVVWAESGLGAHATAMFLDDRVPMQQLRAWFRRLVGEAGIPAEEARAGE